MLFCRALVEMLFASLWQGAAIGLVVAAVLAAVGPRLNAVTRHVILQATLLAMIATPFATTLSVFASGAIVGGFGASAVGAASLNGASASVGARFIDVRLSDPVAFSLAVLWLAGFAFFVIRIARCHLNLARVLRGSSRFADRGDIRLFVSASVSTPFAAGLIRPAIVLPEIIVDGGDELNCAILHEVAHLRRRDTWSQTFELMAQAVFFFNPVLLLVLRALRWQREAACDDWAAQQAGSVDTYTRALASLALRCNHQRDILAACGAIGFEHPIVSRIERLEDPRRNNSLNLSTSAAGGFIILLLPVAFGLLAAAPAVAISAANKDAAQSPALMTTSAPLNGCDHDVAILQPRAPSGPLPPGTAWVYVQVAASGAVKGVRIATSSGNAALDRVTMDLARRSTYAPAVRNCRSVAGVYKFMLSSHGRP